MTALTFEQYIPTHRWPGQRQKLTMAAISQRGKPITTFDELFAALRRVGYRNTGATFRIWTFYEMARRTAEAVR